MDLTKLSHEEMKTLVDGAHPAWEAAGINFEDLVIELKRRFELLAPEIQRERMEFVQNFLAKKTT